MYVNIRDFRNNLKKYLDLSDKGEVIFLTRNDSVYTIQKKTQDNPDSCVHNNVFNTYGCGCTKVALKYLCPKHGRM